MIPTPSGFKVTSTSRYFRVTAGFRDNHNILMIFAILLSDSVLQSYASSDDQRFAIQCPFSVSLLIAPPFFRRFPCYSHFICFLLQLLAGWTFQRL